MKLNPLTPVNLGIKKYTPFTTLFKKCFRLRAHVPPIDSSTPMTQIYQKKKMRIVETTLMILNSLTSRCVLPRRVFMDMES